MSVVKNSNYGWFISHETLIKQIYTNVSSSGTSFQLKPQLFQIYSPYKLSKSNKSKCKTLNEDDSFEAEVQNVEKLYKLIYDDIKDVFVEPRLEVMNTEAVNVSNTVYNESGLLEPFLPPNPSCLEIFARYLLPNWTSYGNEVLRLQHECLYEMSE